MEDGGYAFPVPDLELHGNRQTSNKKGMTLRDYFAAAALQGLLARPSAQNSIPRSRESISETAYAWADSMIKARAQAPQEESPEK